MHRDETRSDREGVLITERTRDTPSAQEEKRRGEDAAPEELGFLDGCRWDKAGNKLADSAPKVLYAQLPVLYVTWLE